MGVCNSSNPSTPNSATKPARNNNKKGEKVATDPDAIMVSPRATGLDADDGTAKSPKDSDEVPLTDSNAGKRLNQDGRILMSAIDETGVVEANSDDEKEVDRLVNRTGLHTMEEVSQHNTLETGIWIVIDNTVYDITPYVRDKLHPASNVFIRPFFGKDATEAFEATNHSSDAYKILEQFEHGMLVEEERTERGPNLTKDRSVAPTLDDFKNDKGLLDDVFVKELYLFPVKGCGGMQVEKLIMSKHGFLDDRIYAVVKRSNMKVINQLTYPHMATIKSAFKDEYTENLDEGIRMDDVWVPFIKETSMEVTWKSCSTKILVWDQGEEISKYLTAFLNKDMPEDEKEEFIFVRIHEDNYRETEDYFSLPFAPKSSQQMSGFQNYNSILLCSNESLVELNKRYQERLPNLAETEEREINWDRFRMNIIIEGLPVAHYEDFMKRISFGEEADNNYLGCAEILWSRRRYFCAVPQVNQIKGTQSLEPISTAQRYRNAITLNDRTSLPGDDAVFFGSFYCVKHAGVVSVGMRARCEHEQLGYNEPQTVRARVHYGLTSRAVGSQFEVDYHSEYQDFKLVEKSKYNHDCVQLRFKMESKKNREYHQSLRQSLKMGDHYLMRFENKKKQQIIRAYTPIFDVEGDDDEMSFELLVKVYPDGLMSSHLDALDVGDAIQCKQDFGKVCYLEVGKMRFGDPRFSMAMPYTLNVTKMNLIAGGSGITPIYQILSNVHLSREFDPTEITFIYANRSVEDILLRQKLDEIARNNKNIRIHYVLSRPKNDDEIPDGADIGRISKDICKQHLFPAENDNVVSLLCGPFAMENAVKDILYGMGFSERTVASF